MGPIHHIAISTVVSGTLYVTTRSFGLAAVSFISGVFIDLDHLIDYMIQHGFPRSSKKFFRYFYEEKYKKITLIFHGWEWLIVLAIAAKLTNWNFWITGVLIGFGQHIVADRLYNITTFRSYSLLWRWRKGFDTQRFLMKNRDNMRKKY
jgi:hypothetical protein